MRGQTPGVVMLKVTATGIATNAHVETPSMHVVATTFANVAVAKHIFGIKISEIAADRLSPASVGERRERGLVAQS